MNSLLMRNIDETWFWLLMINDIYFFFKEPILFTMKQLNTVKLLYFKSKIIFFLKTHILMQPWKTLNDFEKLSGTRYAHDVYNVIKTPSN